MKSSTYTLSHANRISLKMTIDLMNILDRFFPLKTLEVAFQSIKISKFSGIAWPQTPPSGSSVIKKNTDVFMYLKS